MARVVLTSRLPGTGPERVAAVHEQVYHDEHGVMPRADLVAVVAGVDAVVCTLADRIDAEVLDAAGPSLRAVANVAVGHDNDDLAACAERSVTVTNTPGVLTDATADLAVALLLMVTRGLGAADRRVHAGIPWRFGMTLNLGMSLRDKTIGIVGPGQIGLAAARRAHAFGLRVLLSGRSAPDRADVTAVAARVVDLPTLLAEADVVSLHCPFTPDTRHLLGAAAFARMKRTAYLVNTSRGPVVDEAALVSALDAGEIAGAGLDVFEHEPAVHPGLLGRDDVVLLPHLGSATWETRTAMADLAVDNVLAVLRGDPPLTPVHHRPEPPPT
ncbi:MAG: 2-hydroxyacid dehydrogenase [Dermatophilaceae bacterium]